MFDILSGGWYNLLTRFPKNEKGDLPYIETIVLRGVMTLA